MSKEDQVRDEIEKDPDHVRWQKDPNAPRKRKYAPRRPRWAVWLAVAAAAALALWLALRWG